MPKKKRGGGPKFEVVVEHPGAVKGHTKGDVITDPDEALIERARSSSLLTLRQIGGAEKEEGPVGGHEPETND